MYFYLFVKNLPKWHISMLTALMDTFFSRVSCRRILGYTIVSIWPVRTKRPVMSAPPIRLSADRRQYSVRPDRRRRETHEVDNCLLL